jgi:hypothetical protein
VLLYMGANGSLAEMIRQVIIFNFQYSGQADVTRALEGVRAASAAVGIVLVVPAGAGWLASLLSLRSRAGLASVGAQFLLLPLIGWPIEMVLSTMSGRGYLHYFIPWAPYVAILAAHACALVLRRLRIRGGVPAALVALALALPILLNSSLWQGYASALSAGSWRARPGGYRPGRKLHRASTSPKSRSWSGVSAVVNFDLTGWQRVSSSPLVHVDRRSPMLGRRVSRRADYRAPVSSST